MKHWLSLVLSCVGSETLYFAPLLWMLATENFCGIHYVDNQSKYMREVATRLVSRIILYTGRLANSILLLKPMLVG